MFSQASDENGGTPVESAYAVRLLYHIFNDFAIMRCCPKRIYVKVSADFDCTGCIHPRSIIWSDGRVFDIDDITDFYPKFTPDHCGDRYTIIIKGETRYLFFERNDEMVAARFCRWFVERVA